MAYLERPVFEQLRQLAVQALSEGSVLRKLEVRVHVRDVSVAVLLLQVRRWRRRRRQYECTPGRNDVQRRRPHRPVRGAAEDNFDWRRADELRDFSYGIGMAIDDVRHADGLQICLVVQRCRRDDGREAGELCELNGYCER